jgi:hypothetical protein
MFLDRIWYLLPAFLQIKEKKNSVLVEILMENAIKTQNLAEIKNSWKIRLKNWEALQHSRSDWVLIKTQLL